MKTKTSKSTLTIGKVAKAAGVGVETVRFYERKGLVRQPKRGTTGFRDYDADAHAAHRAARGLLRGQRRRGLLPRDGLFR